ncbi:MAG: transposase [Gammaproteobacteria bacterium]|nr:MAG: transposase [Gammaproteobacteria bacterium]
MPRRARLVVPKIPLHIIQRGNNRQACFFHNDDYLIYLDWLLEYSQKTDCTIHAYVLMTNHVHLLLTPNEKGSVGSLMKRLGQRYVQYVNRTYRRSGTLWEGRFRSCLVQEDNYLLHCQRYIELNPVRAELVDHPADYRWSSYRTNAQGEADKVVKAHFMYEALGLTETARQANYRELFRDDLEPGLIDEIRKATKGNFVLGDNRFKEEIGKTLGRRVIPGKAGRPVKHES